MNSLALNSRKKPNLAARKKVGLKTESFHELFCVIHAIGFLSNFLNLRQQEDNFKKL